MNTSSDLKQGNEQCEKQFSVDDSQSKTNNGHVDSQLPIAPQPDVGGPVAPKSHVGGSTLNSQPMFVRCPGETPRAFNAFTTYFRLGHGRTLQAVADKLGDQLPTVKNWSSKYDWSERINHFNSGLLEQQAQAEADAARKAAADWAKRTQQFREQEWESAQRLLTVVQCCLENFGDRELEKIRLSELSRALSIASKMSHSALQSPASDDDRPSLAPIQIELLAALRKMPDPVAPPPAVAVVSPTTTTHSKN